MALDEEQLRLAEERDFLLASLDDLEIERAAGDLTDADYVTLRAGYERRTVEVISALAADKDCSEEADLPAAGPDVSRRRRWARRALAATAAAAMALGAGFLVDGSAGNRLPTQTITGSVPAGLGNDLADAQVALAKGDDLQALKLFQAVLAAQPDEPEALAYSGWIVANTGAASNQPSLVARGIASMQSAVRADPSYPDAHLLLGLARLGSGDPAGAVTELRLYLALHPPPQAARAAQAALAKAEAAVAGQRKSPPPSTSTSGP